MNIATVAEALISMLAISSGVSFIYFIFNQFVKGSLAKTTDGQLHYGTGATALTIIATLSTFLLLWFIFFSGFDGYKTPLLIVGLFTGFMAVYCWSEVLFTKGTFDEQGITLHRLGRKRHHTWATLSEVEIEPNASWYAMHFKDAKPIRISLMLKGYGEPLSTLEKITGKDYTKSIKDKT